MTLWTNNLQIEGEKNTYIIGQILGGGGFGITYKAKSLKSGKIFAIKTLNETEQFKATFNKLQLKFITEAMTLARFSSHPHIVTVYEVIEHNGLYGMVMEYLDGEDLKNYVDNHGAFTEKEALRIIQQVGDALTFMHSQNTIHRDIKPHNIVLRKDTKDAFIIDFGLAREFNPDKTQEMTKALTEGYAPIEQYETKGKFGAYTDVYALAATLYFLLTAQSPFPAKFRKPPSNIPLIPPKQHNPALRYLLC